MLNGADLPPTIGGRYRPIRLLGRGGMGAVYEVEHLHTGQHLAMKVLLAQLGASAEAVERFKREARTSSRIHSDHVVRVTDADRAPELDGAPFLVMELLEGADLERATHGQPSAPADVVEWLRQIARALAKAHELNIVHRDLKPENLFLTRREDGTPCVKVLDFGIAKIIEEGAPSTHSGQILGTPTFMAPEQAHGMSANITARTDLFALGLIAFRLLVGRDYWNEGNVVRLIAQIAIEPMVAASARGSTLGPRFDEWFARACNREQEARFASAAEQVEALARALGLSSLGPGDVVASTSTPPAPVSSDQALGATQPVRDIAMAETVDAAVASPSNAEPRVIVKTPSASESASITAIPGVPARGGRGVAIGAAVIAVGVAALVGISLPQRSSTGVAAPVAAASSAPSSVAPASTPVMTVAPAARAETPASSSAEATSSTAPPAVAPASKPPRHVAPAKHRPGALDDQE